MLTLASIGSVLTSVVSWPFKEAGNSFLSVLASAIQSMCLSIVKTMSTFWVSVPTPNVATSTGGSSPSTPVAYLDAHLDWYIGAFCLLAVIVGVIRMMWEQRASAGFDLLKGLVVFVAVSAGALTVISLLIDASDQFSTWILASSLSVPAGQLGNAVGRGFNSMLVMDAPGVPVFLSIVVGLFASLGAIVQVFLMVMRSGMLVVLTGCLPLTFSLWTTDLGKQWSKKATAWLLAFILYKPAAAIIYATAFQLMAVGTEAGSLDDVLTGMTLMVMAIIALPALMRFLVPAVGSIASGGAGMAMGIVGGAAGMAMLPTGATSAASMRGGASMAGAGPSGASPSASAGGGNAAASAASAGAGVASVAGATAATGGAAAPVVALAGALKSASGAAEHATEQSTGEGEQA